MAVASLRTQKCPTTLEKTNKKKMPTSLLKYKVRAVFPRDNKVTGCSSSLEPQGTIKLTINLSGGVMQGKKKKKKKKNLGKQSQTGH